LKATDLSLTVLDDGASRPDLAMRRELKFVFSGQDVATLRRLLMGACRPIRYAGPVSTVRSVYFDDPTLRDARNNLDGVGLRQKTRLRWYDNESPTRRLILEVKWRRHRFTGKHRLHLECSRPPGETSYRDLLARLRRDSPTLYQHRLAQDIEAVVLVEYRREHFAVRAGHTRITLDYDLRFFPQMGRFRFTRRFGELLPGVVIIEVKSAAGDEVSLPGFLAPLRVRASRFSKYVIGCQRLGYLKAQ